VYGVHTYKSAKTIISNGVGTSGFCTRFLAQAQVGVLRVKKVSKLKKIDID
jgi:predicted MPP superfamily phosphohydrolase